jgi:hypothetical protein
LLGYFSKGDIKKYVKRVERGLGVEIQGSAQPGSKLVKVYMTGKSGAGRMIVLIYVRKGYYLPIIVRLKTDKIVGGNLSKGSKAFQNILETNVVLMIKDLNEGKFEEL